MTRRSALLAGLAVLTVLLGAQVIGDWLRRPVSADTTLSSSGQRASAPTRTAEPPTTPAPARTAAPVIPHRTAKPPRKPDGAVKPTGLGKLVAMGVKVATGSRGVALTFDDGPHPEYTPEVLTLLRTNGVRAVFCLVGSEVRSYPELVRQIARDGHTLCNHTWRHELGLGSRSWDDIRTNLAQTNAEIRRVVPGAKIPYYRQPGGKWTPAVVGVAREQGMVSLGWTVDPRDWDGPHAKSINARVLSATTPGSVILLHDAGGDQGATVAACRTLIPTLKERYKMIQLR